MKRLFYIVPIFILALVFSCSGNDEETPGITDNFDRGKLLTNIADNIIIPAQNDFKTQMDALKSAGDAFAASPNNTNLTTFRTNWLNAYKAWQPIEMFDIGKAEELQYKFFMNVYPLTISDVEKNISSGSYDLNSNNNHDAQGFAALDYLLHGIANSDNAILEMYTTDANASNRKKYIKDILDKMSDFTNQVVNSWSTYRDTFVASTDNTGTSSLNKLVNDFIFYYEKGLRANKFGIPAGIFSSEPLPEKVEAYYKKDVSKELSLIGLDAVKKIFEGVAFGGSTKGESFATYLESLNRADLKDAIIAQFAKAETQINTLDNNYYNQVKTDNTAMTKAYDELQKAVVLIKADMMQIFNISPDFKDGDGDS